MKTLANRTLLVIGFVVLAVLGLWLVRTFWPGIALSDSNEIGDDFITVLGTAYGVLVAFMVSAVWGRYTEADRSADTETAQILSLLNLSRMLSYPSGPNLAGKILQYAHSVVEDEWPLLQRGKGSEQSRRCLQDLWESFGRLSQEPVEREFLLAEALRRLEEVSDSRRLRLFNADDSIPSVLWNLLVVEGVITVSFTYLLSAPTMTIQVLMTIALTVTVAASLQLIQVLDHPFAGSLHITAHNLRNQIFMWEQFHPEFIEPVQKG